MSVEVLLFAITTVIALVSVFISNRTAKTTARLEYELEMRRSRASREELVQQVMTRYREPLVQSAYDLQSRIYNIIVQRFLAKYYTSGTSVERDYALRNTLFVFAEYLCWVEVMRREVQFLDLGDVERNLQLVERLDVVNDIFATDTKIHAPAFRLFNGQQRALGEVMIEVHETARSTCMGYARFVAKLDEDPSFADWFEPLEADVKNLAGDLQTHVERLVPLQHALIDLIDFLDDPPTRFPRDKRTKLP